MCNSKINMFSEALGFGVLLMCLLAYSFIDVNAVDRAICSHGEDSTP